MFYGILYSAKNLFGLMLLSNAVFDLLPAFFLFLALTFSVILVLIPAINPIYNVITFIVVIIFSALFVATLKLYFLSFALVLIYVGAISVLFIFTLMVVGTRPSLKHRTRVYLLNVSISYHLFYYFFSFIYFYNSTNFIVFDYSLFSIYYFKEYFFAYFYASWNDLAVLGFYLFTYRFLEILLLIILLISGMICSISIVTSKTFVPKLQSLSRQLNSGTAGCLYFLNQKKKKINAEER